MPIDLAIRGALTQRINQLLGPPASESHTMRRWINGAFELGMDLTDGPSLWLETRWFWDNVLLIGVDVEFVSACEPRRPDLDDGFTCLGSNPLYRIRPKLEELDAVMTYLQNCRERALQV